MAHRQIIQITFPTGAVLALGVITIPDYARGGFGLGKLVGAYKTTLTPVSPPTLVVTPLTIIIDPVTQVPGANTISQISPTTLGNGSTVLTVRDTLTLTYELSPSRNP
jgi:hypothetical protein